MNDIKQLPEPPLPGQNWLTLRGAEVKIHPSSNQDIIEAEYVDIRCGGFIPVQFDKNGHKITKPNGLPDQLDKRVERY